MKTLLLLFLLVGRALADPSCNCPSLSVSGVATVNGNLNVQGFIDTYNGNRKGGASFGAAFTLATLTDGPRGNSGGTLAIFNTAAADATYKVWWYGEQTASGSGGTCATSATIPISLQWTGPSAASSANNQSSTGATLTLTAIMGTNNSKFESATIRAKGGTTINLVEGTFTNGNCTTQPTFTIWSGVTQL